MLDRVAENPQAANNFGVYLLLSGDLDTAETTSNRHGPQQSPSRRNLDELKQNEKITPDGEI